MQEDEKTAEQFKIVAEYLRHVTTLSTGSIVVMVTFKGDLPGSLSGWFVSAVSCFAASVFFATLTYGLAIYFESPKMGGGSPNLVRVLGGLGLLLALVMFLVGLLSLVVYAIIGVQPASESPCAIGSLQVRVRRFEESPIIRPDMDERMGANVQGPSLIRVPEWISDPLGRYYLYFADHKGSYIRLAYADRLQGPWRMHTPGSLELGDSHFLTEPPADAADPTGTRASEPHIASPDVHVLDERREIVMYFHGLEGPRRQVTRVATSADGIHFQARPEILGRSYFRVFEHQGWWYALAMPGVVYRSPDGLAGFETGPTLFDPNMRHSALLQRGEQLLVFWTHVGDVPERVLLSTIDLAGDWSTWKESQAIEVLRPEHSWEGAGLPLEPSARGPISERVNQVRDPTIFEEDGHTYLLYSVAGESGIAIAELTLDC